MKLKEKRQWFDGITEYPYGSLLTMESIWPPKEWYITHVRRGTVSILNWLWFVFHAKLKGW